MNNSIMENKKEEKKLNNEDNDLITRPDKSGEEELQEITNSLNRLNSFLEFYDRKIEESTKMNAELLSKYYRNKNIIETYNAVKEKGAISVFGFNICCAVGCVVLPLFLILGIATSLASEIYKVPETADVLLNVFLFAGGGMLPVALVSAPIFSPLLAKINKSKYEKLNMTEEDVEVIKKKVDKNENQIEELKNIKSEILNNIKQLKEIYVNKKIEIEENKELSVTESIDLENTYEDTYVDSYEDTVMSSCSCAPALEKPKKLDKIRK